MTEPSYSIKISHDADGDVWGRITRLSDDAYMESCLAETPEKALAKAQAWIAKQSIPRPDPVTYYADEDGELIANLAPVPPRLLEDLAR